MEELMQRILVKNKFDLFKEQNFKYNLKKINARLF